MRVYIVCPNTRRGGKRMKVWRKDVFVWMDGWFGGGICMLKGLDAEGWEGWRGNVRVLIAIYRVLPRYTCYSFFLKLLVCTSPIAIVAASRARRSSFSLFIRVCVCVSLARKFCPSYWGFTHTHTRAHILTGLLLTSTTYWLADVRHGRRRVNTSDTARRAADRRPPWPAACGTRGRDVRESCPSTGRSSTVDGMFKRREKEIFMENVRQCVCVWWA